jgi:hypothetical protein
VSNLFERSTLRVWFVAAALLGATSCSGGDGGSPPAAAPSPHFSSNASIWFHPMPAASLWSSAPPGDLGSTDYAALFAPNNQWPQVAAHTGTFGLYAGWVLAAGDPVLASTVAFLNAHGMGIELEAPALQARATCGSGVEGYVPVHQTVKAVTLAYLSRLQALGAKVTYVKVDEPYFFGSVVADPRACHFPVATVASEVSTYVQIVHEVYPNAVVGDVEPVITGPYVPDVVTALTQWHQAYAAANGAPFPFYIADIDFSNIGWPPLVKSLESATHSAGMRFGIIYIGDPQDTSDAEWTGKVVSRFETYQGSIGGSPDIVLFQSWEYHPKHCLPETSPLTFTGAISRYIAETSP